MIPKWNRSCGRGIPLFFLYKNATAETEWYTLKIVRHNRSTENVAHRKAT